MGWSNLHVQGRPYKENMQDTYEYMYAKFDQ